jgi:hypothetical protein
MKNLPMEKLGPRDPAPGIIDFDIPLPWISRHMRPLGWVVDPFAHGDAIGKLFAFTLGRTHRMIKN